MIELDTLKVAAIAAEAPLDAASEALRACSRAINDLGSLASKLQGAGQDAESVDELPRPIRAFLDGSLLQRTEYVNLRAAEFVKACRLLSQGLRDLKGDCEKVVVLIDTPADKA